MPKLSRTLFAGLWAALLAMGFYACTDSNFAGNGVKKGASLSKGKDSNDDGDADGADTDGTDGGCPVAGGGKDAGTATGVTLADCKDSGGADATDGKDTGTADGKDSTGTPDGDIGTDDSNGTDAKDTAIEEEDETSIKTRHDGTVTRTQSDDHFSMKIETKIKGAVVQTVEIDTGDDDAQGPWVMTKACRNTKETCLHITFTNHDTLEGHQEVIGETPCVFNVQENGTSASLDVDTNGGNGCKPPDESLIFTCPQSKSLKVQLCTGG